LQRLLSSESSSDETLVEGIRFVCLLIERLIQVNYGIYNGLFAKVLKRQRWIQILVSLMDLVQISAAS
jgi:hypothetical protein